MKIPSITDLAAALTQNPQPPKPPATGRWIAAFVLLVMLASGMAGYTAGKVKQLPQQEAGL